MFAVQLPSCAALSRPAFLLILPLLAAGLFAACDEPRELMTEARTVALDGAARVEVGLSRGAGELRLRGSDQASLLEAAFEFNRESLRPEVEYRVLGDKGLLQVRHGRRRGVNFGTVRNRWDLSRGRTVPVDLDVDLGAGRSDLDLRGLNLQRVEIDMGVGEMELDLRGPHTAGLLVKIDGGVGSGKLALPAEVGVRVKVDGGIGSVNVHALRKDGGAYVNDAYWASERAVYADDPAVPRRDVTPAQQRGGLHAGFTGEWRQAGLARPLTMSASSG